MEETGFDRSRVMNQHVVTQTIIEPDNSSQSPEPLKGKSTEPQVSSHIEQAQSAKTSPEFQHTSGTKKSYLAKLKPIERSTFQNQSQVLQMMLRPLILFKFPIIVYAGFCYGCNIVWLSVLNATQSLVLSNSPYNMTTSQVGLTFIAPLIGTTLA